MSSHIAAPRILTDAAGSTSLRRGAWLQKKHQDVFRSKHGLKFTSIQAGASPALLKLLQRQSARNRDVYQFGVYTGVGLGKIASFLRGGFGQLWAFDSFQGIPEEPASENEALWTGDFRQGGYSAADALGVYDLESLVANIHQRVRRPNTTYVPGFFNVSLTDSLIRRAAGEGRPFQPALFVDVDVRAHLVYRHRTDRYRDRPVPVPVPVLLTRPASLANTLWECGWRMRILAARADCSSSAPHLLLYDLSCDACRWTSTSPRFSAWTGC